MGESPFPSRLVYQSKAALAFIIGIKGPRLAILIDCLGKLIWKVKTVQRYPRCLLVWCLCQGESSAYSEDGGREFVVQAEHWGNHLYIELGVDDRNHKTSPHECPSKAILQH